jgi:hypothetical protein
VKLDQRAGAGHEIEGAESHAVNEGQEAAGGDFHLRRPFFDVSG